MHSVAHLRWPHLSALQLALKFRTLSRECYEPTTPREEISRRSPFLRQCNHAIRARKTPTSSSPITPQPHRSKPPLLSLRPHPLTTTSSSSMAPRLPAAVTAATMALSLALALLPLPESASGAGAAVGVNWGTMMSHPMHPSAVVQMLLANGVDRVKMFDADPWTVSALAGSAVQAMLAVPNDHLASLARDPRRARDWVYDNVTNNILAGIDVRYVRTNRCFPQSSSTLPPRARYGMVCSMGCQCGMTRTAYTCGLRCVRSVRWNCVARRGVSERIRNACMAGGGSAGLMERGAFERIQNVRRKAALRH